MKTGLLLFFVTMCLSAFSATGKKYFKARKKIQNQRVRQGLENGSINKREASALRRSKMRIKRSAQLAQSDGVVTKREKIQLNRKMNRRSRLIKEIKNNNQ